MLRSCFVFIALIIGESAFAQSNARYTETTKKYITYPFSDPDPIPSTKKIYPYFRFDGFSEKGIEKEWKVVLLENDYISVQIMPEIGGKVWTAIDKASGKPFLYNNDVVKFRDIAMRGPWVSGGIEANYGIIGHTPNSATPVDYLVRSNADGSVSCFTSTLDLLTRTTWVLEIKLEKDKGYFTTRSFWFNSTGVEQPYYTWMNAGIPVGKGLKFLYPGNHYIGHGGEAFSWPKDQAGRDLSYYSQNNFEGSKSYHVLGAHSNYFGAHWEDEDFGMIHYADRDNKLGKKIFLWAQSEQGRVWEDLLTNHAGQYVEVQSGRLFNQNMFKSSLTPFKQIGFAPYVSDSWIEYWYPFKGIGGFTEANLLGAFKLKRSGNSLLVDLSPIQFIQDSLSVYDESGNEIGQAYIDAKPLQKVSVSVLLAGSHEPATLKLKGQVLDLKINQADQQLSRPVESNKDFNEESAYGLYLQGRDLARFREYQNSEAKILASLEKDSLYLPSLVEYGKLKLFRMQYDSAFFYLRKALAIDTYHGEANYYYGIAASKLSKAPDALDGFEVASLTPEFRSTAYTALAHQYFKSKDFAKAKNYASLSLKSNIENVEALQILSLIARLTNDQDQLERVHHRLEKLNPLNHFLQFEKFIRSGSSTDKEQFVKNIRNELPVETYLELAIWYANLGRERESKIILELAPQNTEVLYWLAWLTRNNDVVSKQYLEAARASNLLYVFPFREESAEVLHWVIRTNDDWQPRYLLALISDYRSNRKEAIDLLDSYKNEVNFSSFYLLKARLYNSDLISDKLHNVDLAIKINPKEWRYGIIKTNLLLNLKQSKEAVQVVEKYYKADRSNYIVGLKLIESLIRNEQYKDADKILSTIHVLPFEGATDARKYYRQTKLMLAKEAIDKKKYQEAIQKINEAEEWPNRLGVGKPYQNMIDSNLENWMLAYIYGKQGNEQLADSFRTEVENQEINEENYLQMIQQITAKADERIF